MKQSEIINHPTTGDTTPNQAQGLLFDALNKITQQTQDLKLELMFDNDQNRVQNQSQEIKFTAQAILDLCKGI